MFILPLARKPDWRNPPVITLTLILICCIVYFGPQRADIGIVEHALAYYTESDLPQLELTRYAAYLKAEGRADEAAELRRMLDSDAALFALQRVQADRAFLGELRAGLIVRPGQPEYSRWRAQRDRFDAMLAQQIIERLAFVPAQHRLFTFLSHMFLHAGLGHLIGNMLVLAIVGYVVEEMLGHLCFLAFYLLGGLGAVGLYWAAYSGSAYGLVGASGAIAAVMGLYTVLLGVKRIDFFYSLLFWFDFVRAPAIILLPLWIGNELFQLGTQRGSHIAYTAHIGGLLAGALLALSVRGRTSRVSESAARTETDAGFEHDLVRAQNLVKTLSVERARQAYAALASRRPTDRRVLSQYLVLARSRPEGDDHRKAVSLILSLNDSDAGTIALQADTFNSYAETASKLRLSPGLMFELARRFARHGRPAEAQRIALALAKHRPQDPELPTLLLMVAKASAAADDQSGASRCHKLLIDLFPDSDAARLVTQYGSGRRS